jgi:creatinine deaminase
MESDIGFQAALEEAKQGAAEGGVPIGACLVSAEGKILGRGHNMRIQKSSAIIHVGRIFCSFAVARMHRAPQSRQ